MASPIALYYEVTTTAKRNLELCESTVFIRGEGPGIHSEITVQLADLRPLPNRVWFRHRIFYIAALIILGSLIGTLYALKDLRALEFTLPCLFIGSLICAFTFRKVEYAVFLSSAGLSLLTIARSGPDRDNFEDFVEKLIQQIEATKNSEQTENQRE